MIRRSVGTAMVLLASSMLIASCGETEESAPAASEFFIDAGSGRDAVVEAIQDLTGGGADVAFECTGSVSVMRQALDCCHVGWGTCVLLGVEPKGAELSFPPVLARYGRTIKGSYFGGVKGRSGLGRFVDMHLDGRLDIDSLITHRITLDQINEGFDMMAAGESLRSVVVFD
jgi:S-(hydroxymethyl)glutathione dehydrogenase/alcohol dehydrogenase